MTGATVSAADLRAGLDHVRADPDATRYQSCRAFERWFAASIAEGRDPGALRKYAGTISERIWARVVPGLDGCLIWDGTINHYGQPTLHILSKAHGNRFIHVRRYLLEQAGTPALPKRRVYTSCGNRRCVALGHIIAETGHWGTRYNHENSVQAVAAVMRRLGVATITQSAYDRARRKKIEPSSSGMHRLGLHWSVALERAKQLLGRESA